MVVIFLITTNAAPDQPQFPPSQAILFFIIKLGVFYGVLGRIFSKEKLTSASHYPAAELKASILAILFFSMDVYLLDCQYYFNDIPLADKLPVIESFFCLLLFTVYLVTMWAQASTGYQKVFGREQSTTVFVVTNLKTNLPIILPWLLLSLFADLLQLSSLPWIKSLLASAWGETIIILIFFLLLAIIFPALITRMWGCTSMPSGPAREKIERLCRAQQVEYADIMLWPLHEGQALTAGVMGVISRFRYLLVTPALLSTMTAEEVEAVMAHELGHVKKRHLQLYLLLFLGFGLFAQLSAYPILHLLTNSEFFYKAIYIANKEPGNALTLIVTGSMFVLLIVYFRYILGFFMRNFERQADLHAMQTMGSSAPLVRVFEKIAWFSGNNRDQPSWHHFGIGQRIDYLIRSEENHSLVKRHDRKVYVALSVLLVVGVFAATVLWRMPDKLQQGDVGKKLAVLEFVILDKISEDPDNVDLYQLLGNLQYSRKKYRQAIDAYKKVIGLNPDLAEVYNNLAWLLLTAEESSVIDPTQALDLAKQAVILQPSPHILDTLALAYFRNGFIEQAILAEKRALVQNPENRGYYLEKLKKYVESAASADRSDSQ